MTRIGLLSDTHNFLDETVFEHFKDCDEIWHGGDFGSSAIADRLKTFKPLRGVYGNIDGNDISSIYTCLLYTSPSPRDEQIVFFCEDVKIMMRHIGGYPPKYNSESKKEVLIHQPQLFISGHSHILKIMYDEKLHCLHINPGAAGKQGWQKVRTFVRFAIDGSEIKNCEVIELIK